MNLIGNTLPRLQPPADEASLLVLVWESQSGLGQSTEVQGSWVPRQAEQRVGVSQTTLLGASVHTGLRGPRRTTPIGCE